MNRRNPAAVFLLSVITFGIYWIVWLAKTRGELNTQGAAVPTTWFVIVPIVSIWWMWKFAEGTGRVSGGSEGAHFALLFLLGSLGGIFVQSDLNKRIDQNAGSAPATNY